MKLLLKQMKIVWTAADISQLKQTCSIEICPSRRCRFSYEIAAW
jgi:hypothetical protein